MDLSGLEPGLLGLPVSLLQCKNENPRGHCSCWENLTLIAVNFTSIVAFGFLLFSKIENMVVVFDCLHCSLFGSSLFPESRVWNTRSAVVVSGFACALEQGHTQLWFGGALPGYFSIQQQDKTHIHISHMRALSFTVLETAACRQGGKYVVLLWVFQMRGPGECQVALTVCRWKMSGWILKLLLPGNRNAHK